MTTEVAELAQSQIERPTNAQPAPQPIYEEAPAAPMTAEQTAGVAKLAEMRQKWADNPDKRDQITKQMNELARHVFHGEAKPGWYGAQTPDPRATSTEPFDALGEALTDAAKPVSAQELEQITRLGKLNGLTAEQATVMSEFARMAGLDRGTAGQIMKAAARHAAEGWLFGEPLNQQEAEELAGECVRAFGSVERAAEESALARAYLKHVGLEKFDFGSLNWDPAVILALAYRGRLLKGNSRG